MIKFVLDGARTIHRHMHWEEVQGLLNQGTPFYLDIISPGEEDIRQLRSIFRFHPTNLEDCTAFSENPKLEEHKEYIFTVVHGITHEIHIFLGEGYIVSVHDKELDLVHEVLQRLFCGEEAKKLDPAEVYYTILDSAVDSYYPILDAWGLKIDEAEELVFDLKTGNDFVSRTIPIRKELMALKRVLLPQKEILFKISHTNVSFIGDETRIYLRDVFDHITNAVNTVEEQRDLLGNLMDAYFSKTSAGMNEVMKRLTVISTIFMPLTFIVGIYGMNFRNMPELEWKYGYFLILGMMVVVAVGSVWFTKKKKWF